MFRHRTHVLSALLAAGSLTVATCLAAQGARTVPAITAADLRSRLFRIADDSMLGRETGSRGAFQTTEYIASEFKRLGLTPMGEQGTWFQQVPFWMAAPAGRTLLVSDGSTLRLGTDYVLPGITRSTPGGLLDVVYGGSANDPTHWISAAQAAGKVVVLDVRPDAAGNRNLPPINPILRAPQFSGAAAIAMIRLDGLSPAAIANLNRYIPRPDTTRFAAVPALLSITSRAADILLAGPAASLTPGMAGRKVQGEMSTTWSPVQYPARNVIGVLPGRDPALRGQYVSVTGHNDHVGICMSPVDHDSMRAFLRVLRPMGADTRTWNQTPEADAKIRVILDSLRRIRPPRADSICNGADDDGTGTVAILELAEYFAQLPMAQRPRRSLLFVSHTAEERGLLGSAWFTDHPTVPVDSIVAEIDEDMIGRGALIDLPAGGPTYLEVVGARRLSKVFGDFLEAANREQPVPFVFNYEFDAPGHPLRYYCRADHYSYARYGIPAVAFSRGEHLDYHQVTDEPQYINYPDMLRVVNLVKAAVAKIGNADRPPKLDKPKGDPRATCVQ